MIPNHPDSNPIAAPCVMVIFGATGDLTKRKLIPALCNLAQDDLLPKQFAITDFPGKAFNTPSYANILSEEFPKFASPLPNPNLWPWIVKRLNYVNVFFL